jgi:hypothetical protein
MSKVTPIKPIAEIEAVEVVAAVPNLDQRIADVLRADRDQLASATLADLLTEVGTEIERNDQLGRDARARAIDPTVIDASARGRAEDSEFKAARLRAGQAALQPLHDETLARERSAQWHTEANNLESFLKSKGVELQAKFQKAVEVIDEARQQHKKAVETITEIFLDIETIENTVRKSNGNAPANELRRVQGLRQLAGKIASFMRVVDEMEAPKFTTVERKTEAAPVRNVAAAFFLSPFEKARLGLISLEDAERQQAAKFASMTARAEVIPPSREQLRAEEDERQRAIYKAREDIRVSNERESVARAYTAAAERRRIENGL